MRRTYHSSECLIFASNQIKYAEAVPGHLAKCTFGIRTPALFMLLDSRLGNPERQNPYFAAVNAKPK